MKKRSMRLHEGTREHLDLLARAYLQLGNSRAAIPLLERLVAASAGTKSFVATLRALAKAYVR